MFNLKNIRENNKGFSLIELMIVVAIIGILASVAIPNFQRFIRRSKQAEAKSNLSMIYTAQRSFHGEWQYYDGRFGHIGFSPEGDLRYRYTTAQVAAPSPIYNSRKGTAVAAVAANNVTSSDAYCAAVGPNVCIEDAASAQTAAGAAGTDSTFTATAGADLQGDNNDEWTINQAKAVIQQSNGE